MPTNKAVVIAKCKINYLVRGTLRQSQAADMGGRGGGGGHSNEEGEQGRRLPLPPLQLYSYYSSSSTINRYEEPHLFVKTLQGATLSHTDII